jgi:D-glycero-alpha-D-manno-heptose 1-phosphate guanylyltransferase
MTLDGSLADVTATILAGGLGTRLRSVTGCTPKVLAPVGGVPFLSHLIEQLSRANITNAVLLVGYGANQVRKTLGDRLSGVNLTYSIETEQLGTGGAVRFALPNIRGKTILLFNGDSYCDLDLRSFLKFHHGHGRKASMTLAWVEDASRFGRVGLGFGDHITHFGEKETIPSSGWINAGIYLVERELLEVLPCSSNISLERDLLPSWVACQDVFGFRGGEFIDIGVPESYAKADEFFRAVAGRRRRSAVCGTT